jgi:hypothetical protein
MIDRREQNNQLILSFIVVSIFSLVTLVSFGIGADDLGYLIDWDDTYPLYEYLINNKQMHHSSLELFYLYIFSFFKLFTNDFEVFKFFNTFVTLSVMAYSYYKISKKYYLYMLLYMLFYLFIDFNIDQFRNALAASFGLLAIVLLVEKKLKYSIILFVFSFLIHNSMIWLFVIYLSKNEKLNKIMIISLIVIVLLPNKFIYLSDIFDYISSFPGLSSFHIFSKIIGYLDTSLDGLIINSLYSFVIFKLILLTFIAYKIKIDKIYFHAFLYALLLYYALIDLHTIGGRIVRDIYLLEPIIVYFALIKKKEYILIILPIVLYNLFTKNIILIERITNG